MQMGVQFAQAQIAHLLNLQMKTVLAALSGRLVPWVKLKAKSVVANLWMQMGARCAQVQNAPLLSLQMKVVCVALPGRLVLRGKLKAKHVEEDQ